MSRKDHSQSTITVLVALCANLGVALLKLVAGLLSGSGALLSEAAHSVGDCSTQVLLLTAVRRSERPADRKHPFGYGKERYFWSLLAAMGILVSGAAFSVYQGVHSVHRGSCRGDRDSAGRGRCGDASADRVRGVGRRGVDRACVRIDADLRAEFPDLDEIFIQPVPRSDPELRHRVLRRYGRALAAE